ncbi:MAG: ExbD/TolR family protein [Chitinophagaceae bacterium]
MPSVHVAKKSTDTDMTPFVDIAFLILSFFIMATKFKPPEPVEIKTPNSVSAGKLPANDAVMVTIDPENRVYFSVLSEKNKAVFDQIANELNTRNNLGLTPAEIANFRKTAAVGVPLRQLKGLLGTPVDEHKNIKQQGIPVLDSATNELVQWIAASRNAFANQKLTFLIKGDSKSKFPTFDAVVSALKRNDQYKYNLVTSPEDAPANSELGIMRRTAKK